MAKFIKYSQLIEHYDEVITQKANKHTVERVKKDLIEHCDKQFEKLSN